MKVKLKSVKAKEFTTEEGEKVPYFWYNGEVLATGKGVRIGSTEGAHALDVELDLLLEEKEGKFGNFLREMN